MSPVLLKPQMLFSLMICTQIPHSLQVILLAQPTVLNNKVKPIFAALSHGGSAVKNLPALQETIYSAGDSGSIPGLGRCPGEGNGNPRQYSGLGNAMDKEAWQATVHGVTKESDTTQQLNNNKNKARFNKHSHQNRFSFSGLSGRTEVIGGINHGNSNSLPGTKVKSVNRVTAQIPLPSRL